MEKMYKSKGNISYNCFDYLYWYLYCRVYSDVLVFEGCLGLV